MFNGLLQQYTRSGSELPETVFGYVAVRATSGASLRDDELPRRSADYHSSEADLERARAVCGESGLQIEAESPMGLSASGPAEAWERLTAARLETFERLVQVGAGRVRYVTHIDIRGGEQPEERSVGK